MNLIELTHEWHAIENLLIESDDETRPELVALLERVETDLAKKIDGYHYFLDRLENAEDYWDKKLEEVRRVRDAHRNTRERLKERLKTHMIVNNLKTLEGDSIKFTLSHTRPRLVVDQTKLPDTYKIITYSADNDRIRDAMADGIEVPGAKLEASYSLRKSLRK